jgi:predicted TIM-barrel fold metal-dependent hydrolase
MRLFDANSQIGPWPTEALAFQDVQGLLAEMDRLGIDQALVYHSLAWQSVPSIGNAQLMEAIRGHPRLFPCWGVLPTGGEEAGRPDCVCDQLARAGARAVRIWPRDHVYPIAHWMCSPLLEALAERRYLLLLDLDQIVLPTGLFDVDPAGWHHVDWLCRTYPDLAVVLTRVGYRAFRVLVPMLRRYPNLYVDLSYFATHQGVEFVAQHIGPDRILFGTGQPLEDPGGAVMRLCYADLDDHYAEQIGFGNLERLLARVQL